MLMEPTLQTLSVLKNVVYPRDLTTAFDGPWRLHAQDVYAQPYHEPRKHGEHEKQQIGDNADEDATVKSSLWERKRNKINEKSTLVCVCYS